MKRSTLVSSAVGFYVENSHGSAKAASAHRPLHQDIVFQLRDYQIKNWGRSEKLAHPDARSPLQKARLLLKSEKARQRRIAQEKEWQGKVVPRSESVAVVRTKVAYQQSHVLCFRYGLDGDLIVDLVVLSEVSVGRNPVSARSVHRDVKDRKARQILIVASVGDVTESQYVF